MDWQQFLSKLKKVGWRSYLYPAISTVLLLLLIILVVSAARYLSNSINKIFSLDEAAIESQLTRVNFDNLTIVAGKLGIEIRPESLGPGEEVEQPSEPTDNPPAEESQPESSEGSELLGPALPTPLPEPPPAAAEVKTNLKIQVLNSTTTAGLAGKLKASVESAGFVAEVGNTSPVVETTVIRIKSAIQASFPNSITELKQIVSQSYTPVDQPLTDDNPYDIIIVIGNK